MKWYKYVLVITVLLSLSGGSVKKDKNLTVFIWFLFFGEVIIGEILKRALGSNLVWYNIFAPMTALFYVYFFSRKKYKSRFLLMTVLSSLYIITGLLLNLDWYGEINTFGYIMILLVGFCFIIKVFLEWLEVPPKNGLIKTPKFWLGLGVLLFTACSLPILVFANPFIVSGEAKMAYSNLLAFGNIILYLGYMMAVISTTRWIKYIG